MEQYDYNKLLGRMREKALYTGRISRKNRYQCYIYEPVAQQQARFSTGGNPFGV